MIFASSLIDAKLGFVSVIPGLYFQVFGNSKRDFGIFKCCSSWTSQFFSIHEKMKKNCFFENKPRLYFRIFHNSLKSREIGIFEVPSYSPLLPLKPFSYSEKMRWGQGWPISKEFCRKKYNTIHFFLFNFTQLVMYLH